MVLGRRQDLALAVDRPAGRGVHEPPHAGLVRGGEHVDRALDVDARVRRPGRRPSGARRSARPGGRPPRAATRPSTSRIASASRMSASTSSTPRSSAPVRFSRRPVEMLSTTVTSSPRSTRASTRFEPMKPAPPVTRVRIRRRHSTHVVLEPPDPVLPSLAVGGLFVTFEGIDRSGKTTQARMLCDALGDRALAVREPGGTPRGGAGARAAQGPVGRRSARTPRRCCSRPPVRSWSSRSSGRRSTRVAWWCPTASSTPRSPTRVRRAGSGSRRSRA